MPENASLIERAIAGAGFAVSSHVRINFTSMKNIGLVIIFDGDDTLWETMPLYVRSKSRFFLAMRRLGFNRKAVEMDFEERDLRNVDRFGFSKKRFETSMVETYRSFCRSRDMVPARAFERRIKRIARSTFTTRPKLVRHAKQLLRRLKDRSRLILLTKGDLSVQKKRIRASGLQAFFEKVIVVPQKETRTFRFLVRRYNLPKAATWSVGNSLKSDINPALKSGT